MGLSSNQARFLSLTSRQVDMEQRIQQICQRRLRLSSELENVATQYNNKISNRKMFTASQTSQGINSLSIANLAALGYKVLGLNTDKVAQRPAVPTSGATVINSQEQFLQLVSDLNSGVASSSANYVLNCDIDLSGTTYSGAVIKNDFSGTFDGNGHTISGLSINTSAAENGVGLFTKLVSGAVVKNMDIENANINAVNSSTVGILSGMVNTGATVDNCYVSGGIAAKFNVGGLAGNNQGTILNSTADVDLTVNNTSGGEARAGGFVGSNNGGGVIKYCNSLGDVTVLAGTYNAGGFSATNESATALIESCYSAGNVLALGSTNNVGAFTGGNNYATIRNCYTVGSVATPNGGGNHGGFIGSEMNGATVTYSYAANTASGVGMTGFGGGIDGSSSTGPTNFYTNGVSSSNGESTSPTISSAWSDTFWGKSTTLPTLKNVGYTAFADDLETGLRNGTYSLAKAADEFTQDPISIQGNKYEEVDWRSTPEIYDELYKGDDVDAENKYDKIISEINAQDKKLQLEQTSVEVEYKAVTSEREAVKKVLDANAQSSFKYFS